MDFADLPNYPMVANSDYSPTNDAFTFPDAFDKAYLADSYSTRPDYTFETMFDTNSFFDRPLSSVESDADYTSSFQPLFSAASKSITATTPGRLDPWTANSTAAFAPSNNFNGAFTTSPTYNRVSESFNVAEKSPRGSSPTPSLCGDGPQPQHLASPSLSPRSLKRESPDEAAYVDDEEPAPKKSHKKRGRPRVDRGSTDSTSSFASSKARTVQRLPHNQVERKYREGLNAELERLRKAVPTLIQRDPRDLTSPPKPSKATILASAIDYIRKIEQERDQLRQENETLKGVRSMVRNC